MPTLARACKHPGCTANAVRGSFSCSAHQQAARTYDDTRASASARGYDRRWRKVRRIQLQREPLCSHCGDVAREVDHIVPIADGGARLDLRNLQSLCKSCHSRKTRAQNAPGGAGRISSPPQPVDRSGSETSTSSGFRDGGFDG